MKTHDVNKRPTVLYKAPSSMKLFHFKFLLYLFLFLFFTSKEAPQGMKTNEKKAHYSLLLKSETNRRLGNNSGSVSKSVLAFLFRKNLSHRKREIDTKEGCFGVY